MLDWEETVDVNEEQKDFGDTPVLPEGDYTFEVVKVEKQYYGGGAKIPECNMAVVSMAIDGGELGRGFCSERLYMVDKMLWKATKFLKSIGLRETGEKFKPSQVIGTEKKTGRAHFIVDEYNGTERNRLSYFIEAPASTKTGFTKGKF